jgi:hypothetical protein
MVFEQLTGRVWREAIVAYFKILSWHLPGLTEVKEKIPQLGQSASSFPGRELR